MTKAIRIGTRTSRLAMWQAELVHRDLTNNQHEATIQGIESYGDVDLQTPLYNVGIQGIFTKALDLALLKNEIDIAVHSFKDVPTALAKGLQVAAVLERGSALDVLVCKDLEAKKAVLGGDSLRIATSSIRRRAQWLHRFPNSIVDNIRGNVNSRIKKLQSSDWHGAIFAAAGLQRLGITEEQSGPQIMLDWMIPAPAQGAIVVVCREGDQEIISACGCLNHLVTQMCTAIERDFLREMQGGCSTPISAFAEFINEQILLKVNVTAPDGSESFSIEVVEEQSKANSMATEACARMLQNQTVKSYIV